MNKKVKTIKQVVKGVVNIKKVDNKLQYIIQNVFVVVWFTKVLININMLEYNKINCLSLINNIIINTFILATLFYIATKINAIISRLLFQ